MLAAVKQLARLVSNSLGLRRYMCGLWRITCRPDGWFRRRGFVKQGGFVAQLVRPGAKSIAFISIFFRVSFIDDADS
jgi:hypothetical protein